jgi:hypothetical protein
LTLLLVWTALTPSGVQADSTTITITDHTFTPGDVAVLIGDTVTWINNDALLHTLWVVNVTDQSTIALSPPLAPGERWSYTVTTAGRYQVYSLNALWITGYLTVNQIHSDIAITAIGVPTTAAVGDLIPINITLTNMGTVTEVTTLTIFSNTTLLTTIPELYLVPHVRANYTLPWNTTELPAGKYMISAVVEPIPGEQDTEDNTLISAPLILHLHDVAVTHIHLESALVTQGDTVAVNVTVSNLGSIQETCVLSIATNTSVLHTDPEFTLTVGQTRSRVVSWETTSMTPGSYHISVDVTPVPGEYLTTNNHAVHELTIASADEFPVTLIAGLLLITTAVIVIYLFTKRH